MKAIVCTKYGSPDLLQFKEVEKPIPMEDEILLKVYASSVNPQDWRLMRADPFMIRLMAGLSKPKNKMLGGDVAGRIEAAGENVKQFQPGDEVFGEIFASGGGAFAEYVSVPENAALLLKPANLTFDEAAAVPLAAFAALQALRDIGKIQPGQEVLINGASGGVGTFAVQIAKSFGAVVTGVCSTRNVDLVRSIGADKVIDYAKENFAQNEHRYDLIIDNVGNPSIYKHLYRHSLTPTGICVIVAGSFFLKLFLGPWMSMTGRNEIGTFMTIPNQKDLISIKELLESAKVVPVIDNRFPLSETAEAIRYLEKGHARGKVIITVAQENRQ